MNKRKCFICDGSGYMCDVCGESSAACVCENDGDRSFSACDDCEATGVASADRDGTEEKKERP